MAAPGKYERTPEILKKMSESQLGKIMSEETRKKIAAANRLRIYKPLSEEARRKISEAKKGKPLSSEHRLQISTALKGRPFSAAHKEAIAAALRTPETRRKLSASHLGFRHSEETRQKLSTILSDGRCRKSDEQRRMASLVHKGKSLSPEHKRKIALALQSPSVQQKRRVACRPPVSAETRRKLSLSHKGITHTTATKQKMAASRKKVWSTVPREKRLLQTHPGRVAANSFCWTAKGGSSLEKIMHARLLAAGCEFETQKDFWPYVVDIFIPALNLAVECDGYYWHNLPGAFKRDQMRDRYLISRYGIRIVRVSEDILRTNPEAAVKEIFKCR